MSARSTTLFVRRVFNQKYVTYFSSQYRFSGMAKKPPSNKYDHPVETEWDRPERGDDTNLDDGSKKTLISDIIQQYNETYSSSQDTSIISAAQSIPNFKHLYIVQLINPFSANRDKVNIIGIKQESITEQDAVATEIRSLLHLIKPSTLIVQLSKDRYEHHLNNMDINDLEKLIPNTWSLTNLLSHQYLTNSARIAMHLINYVIMDFKIRMNPYLFALLYADNEDNKCDFVEHIILGDMQHHQHTLNRHNKQIFSNLHKYMSMSSRKQRKQYGAYPGVSELLFGVNSVPGVFEWLTMNKESIKVKEKDVHQFAIDMTQKLDFGKDILETSAKSMAYYTHKAAEKHQGNIMVLCNIFVMLSLPMHFGKVDKDEIRKLNKTVNQESTIAHNIKYIYKRWLFNYWNGLWWTLCGIHTFQETGIHNLDYPYLIQCGLIMPAVYPALYILLSVRARQRVRKMQKIILGQRKKVNLDDLKNKKIKFD